jgi:hypothetical protein
VAVEVWGPPNSRAAQLAAAGRLVAVEPPIGLAGFPRLWWLVPCATCGGEFLSTKAHAAYCGEDCRRRGAVEATQRYRARRRGRPDEEPED